MGACVLNHMTLISKWEAAMQMNRDGCQKWQAPAVRGSLARRLSIWKMRSLQMWRDLGRISMDNILMFGMVGVVVLVMIWMAAKAL